MTPGVMQSASGAVQNTFAHLLISATQSLHISSHREHQCFLALFSSVEVYTKRANVPKARLSKYHLYAHESESACMLCYLTFNLRSSCKACGLNSHGRRVNIRSRRGRLFGSKCSGFKHEITKTMSHIYSLLRNFRRH